MKKILFTTIAVALCIHPVITFAEDLEMINRPVNISGMTGLLQTTAPFTLPQGTIEVAAGAFSEKSTQPDYSINEMPSISISYGLSEHTELALQGSYYHKTSDGQNKERGAGDTTLSFKWNFLPQKEASLFPALALIVTGIAPTNNSELRLSSILHWGSGIGLSAGSEIPWGDHVLGIYADAQMIVHDLSDERYRDRYGIINAGALLPISKYRNLQMLLEYTVATGIDRLTDLGADYSGFTYGLRLVTERFNLTIGTQFLHKPLEEFDNSSRVMGMMSLKM